MSEPKIDLFTGSLMTAYEVMKSKGRWMESGEIEYADGRRFSYKIQEKQTKKGKCSA